jgi:hypothetical protein
LTQRRPIEATIARAQRLSRRVVARTAAILERRSPLCHPGLPDAAPSIRCFGPSRHSRIYDGPPTPADQPAWRPSFFNLLTSG